MPNTENVKLEIEKSYAYITINRPERKNALDGETWKGLEDAAQEVKLTPEVKVVILSGAEDVFCSGLDLKAASTPGGMNLNLNLRDGVETLQRISEIYSLYENLPVPVIAAIKKACLGAGMELALACDIRIASSETVFSIPEVTIGLVPDGGGTQRLPRLVGPGMAKELVLTGRKIDAEEALRIGLINHAYPADSLMEKAQELAGEIVELPSEPVQASKRALNMAMQTSLEAGLKYETATAERVLGDRAKELFKKQ